MRKKRQRQAIPVGRNRVQLDIQELPGIRGQTKRAYKISLIHLRTRMKYSEIRPRRTSKAVAEVVEQAISRLPPFHLVVTDNAMEFTMAYTAHPSRKTTFERTLERLGRKHYRIPPRSPWKNGFIERSHRTDNEECLQQQMFTSSEERRYIYRLWEMYYNTQRSHQGIDGQTPYQVFCQDYPLAAAWGSGLIF